jgi:hypothetical protein
MVPYLYNKTAIITYIYNVATVKPNIINQPRQKDVISEINFKKTVGMLLYTLKPIETSTYKSTIRFNQTQLTPQVNKRTPATVKIMHRSTKRSSNRLTTSPQTSHSYSPLVSYTIFKKISTSKDRYVLTTMPITDDVNTTERDYTMFTQDDAETAPKTAITMHPSTLYLSDMFRGVFKTEYVWVFFLSNSCCYKKCMFTFKMFS